MTGRVLWLVAKEGSLGDCVATWLCEADLGEVRRFTCAEAMLASLREGSRPCALVTGLCLPDLDGLRLCRLLRSAGHELPIVVFTNTITCHENSLLAQEAGATALVSAPLCAERMIEATRDALSGCARDTAPLSALVVTASTEKGTWIAGQLTEDGYRVTLREGVAGLAGGASLVADAGAAGLAGGASLVEDLDVALIDGDLPEAEVDAALAALHQRCADCTLLVLAGHASLEQALGWMRQGATAVLREPAGEASEGGDDARGARFRKAVDQARRERDFCRSRRLIEQQAQYVLESERNYRALFHGTADPIIIANGDLRIMAANAMACDVYGYTHSELLSMSVPDLDTPFSAVTAHERMHRLLGHGRLHFEAQHQRKDGSPLDVEVQAQRIAWDGQPAVLAICRDITERKRAENALRQSEARFRTLFESMQQGVIYHDASGRITGANHAAQEILGLELHELQGRTPHDPHWKVLREDGTPFPVEELPPVIALRRGEAVRNEVLGVAHGRDQEVRWLLLGVLPEFRPGEVTPCGVVATFSDITSLKRTQEALLESEHALLEAHRIGRLAGLEHDLVTGKVRWAEENLRLLGLPEGTRLAGFEELQRFLAPESLARLREAMEKTIAHGVPAEVDVEVTRADGVQAWHTLRVEGMRGPDGSVVRLTGTIQDITERVHSEQARARLEAELQHAQKMESVGRLAGGVAHDFNNMLVVIIAHLEMATLSLPPNHAVLRHLQEIRKAADRSTSLIRQLLAYARRQAVNPTTLDMNRIVTRLLEMLHRLIGEHIELRWQPGPSLWPVLMDLGQVDQVLANLCVNARDAIEGSGEIAIETRNVSLAEALPVHPTGDLPPGDYVLLTVRDNGCGMPPEALAKVFEPFFTTKEEGRGTGLGLATVYGIITQNHGGVRVTSKPGQGTTFELYLPRQAGEAEEAPPETAPDGSPRGHECILLVEDNPSVRDATCVMLKSLGYRPLPSSSGREALALAQEHQHEIQLVLTDVIMPEMDGRELAGQLLSQHPRWKVLYMSGYATALTGPQGALDDGIHFLQKPFTLLELGRMVRQVLSD